MSKNQRRFFILATISLFVITGCSSTKEKQDSASSSDLVGADVADPSRSGLSDSGADSGMATDMSADDGSQSGMPSETVVYFDFDSSSIGQEARAVLGAHAAYLAANPSVRLRVEGHADERGTREYNMALGEKRANAVGEVISLMGASQSQMESFSFGEEKPVALGHDEYSYQLNRRVELIY